MFAFSRCLFKPGSRVLNALLLLSLLVPGGIGGPSASAAGKQSPAASVQAASSGPNGGQTLGLTRPEFTRPEPRYGRRPDQAAGLDQPAATFQCLNSYCSDTNPGVRLTERVDWTTYWSVYNHFMPSELDFNILCQGANCWQRDIYYRAALIDSWSNDWWKLNGTGYAWGGTGKLISDLNTDYPYFGTGAEVDEFCGIGYKGDCEIETSGVIKAGLMSIPSFWVSAGIHTGSLNVTVLEHKVLTVEVAFDPALLDNPIPPESTYCSDCSTYSGATGFVAKPINTHSGSLSYPVDDLALATSAGPLVFQRLYASAAVDAYTSPLGYGWTHNQDARLVFSSDPLGEPGFVLFKHPSGNLYYFWDIGDGRYRPYAGVTAALTRSPGPPVTYTLTDQAQNSYLFDETGLSGFML